MVRGHDGFPVYVDSPLAVEATGIYLQCDQSCFDEETAALVRQGINPIWFDDICLSVTSDESKQINFDKRPKVILSASGMCEAGRIRHHLKHNLWGEENTILFVCYQAQGSLGRKLQDGALYVRLFGEDITVNAEIAAFHGTSGHADQAGLLRWLAGFKEKPQMVFINHGDDAACMIFQKLLTQTGYYAEAPYHKIQIDLTYNSNHIEGSRLTHDQTRYIFETNTIGFEKDTVNVDDVIETSNHFRCIDMVIDQAGSTLTERFIKELHFVLKIGTSDSRKDWFAAGEYKKLPNEVGGNDTTLPENVAAEMRKLLTSYNELSSKTFEDIVAFERIHPFQDGNGRVGRLILFKECLKHNIVPFIIEDNLKLFYYRGLKEWDIEKGFLMDTCLTAQDRFKAYLDYFRIAY